MTLETSVDESPLEVVNIVGSGDLNRELDLEQLAFDVDIHEANYKPQMGSVFLKVKEDSGLVILYRSGKYIIRGGKEFEKLYQTKAEFLEVIRDRGIIEEPTDSSFGINNLVFVGDIDQTIQLETLTIQLGFENAEFEPVGFQRTENLSKD